MPAAGPLTYLDFDAEPTEQPDGLGGTVAVYPPRPGVFAICDLDTFGQAADLLTPFRVWPVPAQHVLAGDDPAAPVQTVTLHFADAEEAEAVLAEVNALPPVPTSPPVFTPEAPPVLTADARQVRLKLSREPHGEGTRLDAVEAWVATQGAEARIEWRYAKEIRSDHPLVGIMGLFFGLDSDGLRQWMAEAAAIGPTVAA